jgi:hypothetical protein
MSEMTVNVLAIINAASEPIETLLGPFLKRMKFPLPPPERPAQFSLRHVFALMVVLSVCLALVTQLRHIGLALSIGAIGMAIGWWRHDWRLSAAAGTALSIFVLTYVASWVRMHRDPVMHSHAGSETLYVLRSTASVLEEYKLTFGAYPETLDELEITFTQQRAAIDGWGELLDYERADDHFTLISRGRDRKRGGLGLDADLVLHSSGPSTVVFAPLTLRQFLYEADGSHGIYLAASIASILAALVWYAGNWGEEPTRSDFVWGLAIAIPTAVLTAFLLAYLYVAAAGSSH